MSARQLKQSEVLTIIKLAKKDTGETRLYQEMEG